MKNRAYLTLLLYLAVSLSVACAAATGPKVGKRRTPTLAKLCLVYATDKCPDVHNYVEIYDLFFRPRRKRAERVLEIGVLDGDSVRLWEAYFPRATIFGIDIDDTSQYETKRIRTFVADQANREQLSQFIDEHGSTFDIVIDDGGHTMEQQQVSFGFFFPHLQSKGIYVIEDIHTSFPELYSGYGVNEDAGNSTFTMITNFIREGSFSSLYLSAPELADLNSQVDHCLYSYRPNRSHSDLFLCVKK